MKLRFRIDQAAAFRAGINAQTSVVDIDVDPASVDEADRALIAERLKEGIEVCGTNESGSKWGMLIAKGPDLASLLAAVHANEKNNQESRQRIEESRQRSEREKQEQKQAALDCLTNRTVETHTDKVYFNQDSFPYSYEWPVVGENGFRHLTEPEWTASREWLAALKKTRNELREALQEKLEAEYQEKEERRLAPYRQIIIELGSEAERERLARGFVESIETDATEILTKKVFADCPLPYLEAPDEEELERYDDETEVLRHEEKLATVSESLMEKVLAAEKKLKAWNPTCTCTPWRKRISLDDENTPWISRFGLRVEIEVNGIKCADFVKI